MDSRPLPLSAPVFVFDKASLPDFAKRVAEALAEDPSLSWQETKDGLLLRAVTELALERGCERLSKKFPLVVQGKPRVEYIGTAPMLEPYYLVSVTTPPEFLSNVVGDLSSRRGSITSMRDETQSKKILAEVPVAEMFDYGTSLRYLTSARGAFELQFLDYRSAAWAAPDDVA
jgi:predicted membrane GTPase involved in stress response